MRRQAARKRFRRLLVEQFEERRVLATAVDDVYIIDVDETLTVEGLGTWSNDEYNNQSWGTGYYCTEYDEEQECIGEWLPDNPGYASGGLQYGPAVGSFTPLDTGIPQYYDENNDPVGQIGFAFSYVPPEGYYGSVSFTYTIGDDDGSSIGTVTIRVSQYAPTAADDSYGTDEDTPLTIEAAGVLNNDSDDNPLTAGVVSNPANGTLWLNSDGTFTYTPYSNFHGTDSFVYEATDGRNATPATVTITVDPILDDPIELASASYSIDTSLGAVLVADVPTGLLGSYSDPDGQPLTAIIDTEPTHGMLTLEEDGSFSYVPERGFSGTDSFTWHANDGEGDSNVATVEIAVSQSRNIAIDELTTNGTNLTVSYAITGGTSIGFAIGLYASADGITPDQLLQTVAAVDLTTGTHSLIISPAFDDLQEDYYLVAVVDHWDEVGETNETDNVALFASGTYLLYEPSRDHYVRVVDGGDSAEAVSVTTPDEETVQISVRDPSATASVPSNDPYLDFNGDGVISQNDIDVLARNLASPVRTWQNAANRFDVDGDTYVVASDLLSLINEYNAQGYHDLPTPRAPGQKYLDVNGDGYFSQNDIDHWNSCRNGGTCTQATWQNPDNILDVNDDGEADIEDQLALIAYLDEQLDPSPIIDDPEEVAEVRVRTHAGVDHAASIIAANSPIKVVIYSGAGNDFLYGGSGDDVLNGGSGDDSLVGGGGDDTLVGGDGNDTIVSGEGDDQMNGGVGNDRLEGGPGDDVLIGSDGHDTLVGGDGFNELHGGDGNDILIAGPDGGFFSGGLGTDQLTGGPGNDRLDGGEGDDVISGGGGDDSLYGGDGDDTLNGGDGDDLLDGGDGDDTLNGEDGNDDLYGGPGTDSLNGGAGTNSSSQDGSSGGGSTGGEIDWGSMTPDPDPVSHPFAVHHWLDVHALYLLLDAHHDLRRVTATLVDNVNGFTLTDFRALNFDCGQPDSDNVAHFPIFWSDHSYTLTVTASAGLSGGGTWTFNPSSLSWEEGDTHYKSFAVSSSTGPNLNPNSEPAYPPGYTAPDCTAVQPPYVQRNVAPTAAISNGWYQLHYGQTLFVDGRASTDADSFPGPLQYYWDVNNDGIFDATGRTANIPWDTFMNLGMKLDHWHTVTLIVSDGTAVDWTATDLILSSHWNMEGYSELVGAPPSPSLQEPVGTGGAAAGGAFLQAGGTTGVLDVSGAVEVVPDFHLWPVAGTASKGPGGPVYNVKTLKGNVVKAWKIEGGQYNCHGFTVGGSKYSIIVGADLFQVLGDAGYVPRPNPAAIKNGDIVTWEGGAHSAIIKHILLKTDGTIDIDGTLVDSKNGQHGHRI